jgi:hypothetical protein
MLAIALNFCLLHAIGLGAIDAAVRFRNCDCALAGRIGALALTLNIHLFTSRREGWSLKGLCTTKATSLWTEKPIKDRFGFDQFPKSPSANGGDDTAVNESLCLTSLCHRQEPA